jgi:hypothetical protein
MCTGYRKRQWEDPPRTPESERRNRAWDRKRKRWSRHPPARFVDVSENLNQKRAGFADPDYALAFRALDGSFSIAQFKRHAVFYGGAVPDHARQAPHELSDTPLPTHLPVFHRNGADGSYVLPGAPLKPLLARWRRRPPKRMVVLAGPTLPRHDVWPYRNPQRFYILAYTAPDGTLGIARFENTHGYWGPTPDYLIHRRQRELIHRYGPEGMPKRFVMNSRSGGGTSRIPVPPAPETACSDPAVVSPAPARPPLQAREGN